MVVVPQWHIFSSSSHSTVLWDNKKNWGLSILPNPEMPNSTTLAVFAGSVLLTHKMLQKKQKIKFLPVKPKYSVSWSKIFHLSLFARNQAVWECNVNATQLKSTPTKADFQPVFRDRAHAVHLDFWSRYLSTGRPWCMMIVNTGVGIERLLKLSSFKVGAFWFMEWKNDVFTWKGCCLEEMSTSNSGKLKVLCFKERESNQMWFFIFMS